MKKVIFRIGILFIIIIITACNSRSILIENTTLQQTNLVDYVNPLIGTYFDYSLFNGNTNSLRRYQL